MSNFPRERVLIIDEVVLLSALATVDIAAAKANPNVFHIHPREEVELPKCTIHIDHSQDWRRNGKRKGQRAR